jgi:probable O-glycosylation ligase (exosortase A-associated)
LFWFLSVATIPAIFFTYSRGALVGFIAIVVLMSLRMKHRVVLIPVMVVSLAIAVFFAPDSWKHRMDPTRSDAIDASAQGRINAWRFAWALASDYPITGGGFGTFTDRLFMIYAPSAVDVHGPHSVYFGILGEHGFVGLLLYLTLVGSCFASTRWVIRNARFYGDQIAANYAHMFSFALVGFLSSGLFLGRAYFDYFYTVVACIAVLKRQCKQAWSEMEAEDDRVEVEETV